MGIKPTRICNPGKKYWPKVGFVFNVFVQRAFGPYWTRPDMVGKRIVTNERISSGGKLLLFKILVSKDCENNIF